MPECGLSLTHIFQYKNRTINAVLIREYMDQRKPYSGIFYALRLCETFKRHINKLCNKLFHEN